jgi:hypothetical protein
MIGVAEEALTPIDPGPKENLRRWIARDPLGVVMVVAPRNYPYLTAVNSVVPPLMAGNAVILKHAAQTLLVGERFQRAFDAADLPPGLFQNLVLTHEQTAAILQARTVDPSTSPGRSQAARRRKPRPPAASSASGSNSAAKTPAMSAPTPISRKQSRSWSTAPSSIRANPAAASSAFVSTGASMRISTMASSRAPRLTCSAIRSIRRRRSARLWRRRQPASCAGRSPRRCGWARRP